MANQNLISLEQDDRIGVAAARLSMDRREFLQFCAAMATTLGLPQGADAAVAEAVATKKRPSVIWLHFQECTGCTESILRAEHPTLEKLILDVISLDYHETLFAAAGHQVEAARKTAMAENKGQYILVVEGAIPTRDGGIYCKIGGKTAIELLKECAADAAAVIAIGSCASWGGMPSTDPNPTGAMGVPDYLGWEWKSKAGVPIVPIVTIGGQETQWFINRGDTLAKLLRLDKLIRADSAPFIFGFPFGLSLGASLNVPLPSQLVTEVLDPINIADEFGDDPDIDVVDAEIRKRMQHALDGLAADRRFPIIG